MDLQLAGKKALISAGHKGIGLFIATRLLEEGVDVSICCRQQPDLDAALAGLSQLGHVTGQVCDMSQPDAIAAWVEQAGELMGGIDICIGNASASGQRGEGPDPWRASKAATINLIAQLAQRWGPEGIRANTVSPGPILIAAGQWDMIRDRMPALYEKDRLQHPLQRMGTGDEIADVVAFLSSPRASWVNGANVVVDGGYTKQVGF